MISEREARMAAENLQTEPTSDAPAPIEAKDVRPELMDRILEQLRQGPELRSDRIAAAREHLAHGGPDSAEIAEKMILRIFADSVR